MHAPTQGGEVEDAHTDVGVQADPVGQPLAIPIVQGICDGGGVGVAIQAPPQFPTEGQVSVGVHVECVGQPVFTPTVQGICGGGVETDRQSPLQVDVSVQKKPDEQGSPPIMQEAVGIGQ